MTKFAFFALYLCVSVFLLVFVPVMLHPTLPAKRKLLFCIVGFMLFVPGGLLVYACIGAPGLAF